MPPPPPPSLHSYLCLVPHVVQQHAVHDGVVHDALLQDGLKRCLSVLKHRHALAGGLALQVVGQAEAWGRDFLTEQVLKQGYEIWP